MARILEKGTQYSGREFHYTDEDFQRVCKLIYQHAGISLSDRKRDLVYSRLARRLRTGNFLRFNDYLTALEGQAAGAAEWQHFVNALTTNLTSFFREAHHFAILTEYLRKLPPRPIHIWCSAASTGEEPYSLAMTVAEIFNDFNTPVKIIASDLDTNVLKTAADGIYAADRVECLSDLQLKKFFLRGSGTREGFVRVRPELRNMLEFKQINLLSKKYPVNFPLDVIFCRNVMIYFDKPTQREILLRFAPLLQPEGLLFAGHSESFLHTADIFRPLGKTVYALAQH